MEPVIQLHAVDKRFDATRALKRIDAQVLPGTLTGLVGPDGAGKTTLMRIMAALSKPTGGQARVLGFDVADSANGIHDYIGYMPQRFGLYEDLSVQQNLALYADLRGLHPDERGTAFDRLLAFTNLAAFTKRLAGSLSGGMKQKLGLACALMARPKILLLDEPSVGVDPVSRQELWQMVQELTEDGMAVVWSSAYLDEAERCEQVLVLSDGELLHDGPPQELTARLKGRSFVVVDINGDRRALLTQALDMSCVRDGVIQGAAVRLVLTASEEQHRLSVLLKQYGARLQAVAPRFEDAFIDMLGGGPGGHSEIASRMNAISDTGSAMAECRDLTKRFGEFTATDSVSFSVRKGEIFGLLGPNGAGKSTTFKMLCGLLKPSEGSAQVVGLDLRKAGAAAKLQLGYMAQKFSLFGLMSVQQNLEFFSGVYGLKGRQRRQRIDEMVEVFELQSYLDQSPDLLPLGYKQRLALACALMHRPKVLFLDEPTSGVDPQTRREFWTHITGLVSKGVTIMVTTHFMDEAEYCDRVALINRARLIALDTPDALKASVAGPGMENPTMEDAFIGLIERQNQRAEAAIA
ncbi:MAG: ATP-binding cassette domain-containing protein [Pseudomonadota bacterium]